MGADAQGEKHLVALDEAMSESEMSWREIMHDLKARGLRAPRLAVADGANGFWAALSAEYPEVAQQRFWLHKIRNVLDKVPEKLKHDVHGKLREICGSTTRAEAMSKIDVLAVSLSKEYPKAAACLRDDVESHARILRVPQSDLEKLAHHESDRVRIFQCPTAHQCCETTAQRHIGALPRLQVDRSLVDDMATHQRLSNDRTCARESCVR
jgi:transposase-like protein